MSVWKWPGGDDLSGDGLTGYDRFFCVLKIEWRTRPKLLHTLGRENRKIYIQPKPDLCKDIQFVFIDLEIQQPNMKDFKQFFFFGLVVLSSQQMRGTFDFD